MRHVAVSLRLDSFFFVGDGPHLIWTLHRREMGLLLNLKPNNFKGSYSNLLQRDLAKQTRMKKH